MKITVFAGAAAGSNENFIKGASALGRWIADKKHTLVYGDGKVGLMGALSDAVLQNGGEVIGIIPQFMVDNGWQREDVTEMIITDSMSTRKDKMVEIGDAFIALPGGAGTLEEIADVVSWSRLGELGKPCILYNIDGFYDELAAFYDKMVANDFLAAEDMKDVLVSDDLAEIERFIAERM